MLSGTVCTGNLTGYIKIKALQIRKVACFQVIVIGTDQSRVQKVLLTEWSGSIPVHFTTNVSFYIMCGLTRPIDVGRVFLKGEVAQSG